MGLEIERKFLIDHKQWERLEKPNGVLYRQSYLSIDENKVVRVRTKGNKGIITIKGKGNGLTRPEFEYEIPIDDANEMIDLFGHENLIEKTRYCIEQGVHVWEVDVFDGKNKGLIVAEIELSEEQEKFDLPDWVTKEVTHDERYLNAHLQLHPFTEW